MGAMGGWWAGVGGVGGDGLGARGEARPERDIFQISFLLLSFTAV